MINKNKITFNGLIEIIENTVDGKSECSIICDYKLAKRLEDFCVNTFVFDEIDVSYGSENEDYLVTVVYGDNKLCYDSQTLKTENGVIKSNRTKSIYYIFTEISLSEIKESLHTDLDYSYRALEDICPCCDEFISECNCNFTKEEDYCVIYKQTCDNCGECNIEIDDSELEEIRLIISTVSDILGTDGCETCITDIVTCLFIKAKEIGKQEASLDIKDYIENMYQS